MSLAVPTLQTDRTTMSPLGFQHSSGMFLLWSHPDVCLYSGPASDHEGRPITLPAKYTNDSDKIIDFWLHAQEDGWGFRWAIHESSQDRFIGTVGFNSLGNHSEIAFHLRPNYWGKGLMTEAGRRAISWALDRRPSRFIDAYIDPNNHRSIRLADKLALRPKNDTRDGARLFQLYDR
ncbi:GNAT family N-acetyltransferase [Parvibaculaceae bacterium PLY_AMNH_Bact1]|nr:GNAT family N-acetyltransferase [Parvibaculaceae bacterium PLY_AMNH_Bact1]